MLKLFRNQGKALRWIMGIILFLVAASMVITLVPNVFGPAGPQSADVLAEVMGAPLTTGDIEVELRQYRSQDVPPEALSMMAGTAIENLIAERVLFAEATSLGLVPSDKEFALWLRDQLPDGLFPEGKFVGERAYAGFVRQQFRRTVSEFERELLYGLAIEMRLRQMVTDAVSVTEDELKQRFHRENDAVRIEWAAVDSAGLRNQLSATPDKLTEYFEANPLRYRHAERRPLKLITLSPSEASGEYEVSDTEIELYYSQNEYRFEQPERVKVRHILFMTMDRPEAESDQALKSAEEVLDQLRAGADFAEMAKEHSQDPGNADNGGDLGWVSRGMMDPAFEEASFALQEPGDLSPAPVKSDFGYHLIRLDDRESGSIKPLAEVREVIRQDLIAERSQSDRYALMERAMETAQQVGTALENAASQLGLPYQEFEPFARAELPDSLPKAAGLVRAVFEEPVGQVFTVAQEETLYVGIVAGTVPARNAEFAEVSDTVREDYLDTESANLARESAAELAEDARGEGSSLASAARRGGRSTQTSEFVKRDGEIGELGPVTALGEDAFAKAGGEVQGPVAIGGRWVVFRTLELRPADELALATQSDTLRETLLGEKRTELFDYFRQQKLQEYSASGQVIRYGDRIQSYLTALKRVM